MSDPVPPKGTKTRVIVIGGGATGALVSFQLAQAGCQVTTFEKKSIGNGASSRSAACIRAQFAVPETVVGMRYSEWFFRNFNEQMGCIGNRTPLIFQNGYLWLYEDPAYYLDPAKHREAENFWKQAIADVTMQKRVGLPVDQLDPAQIKSRWPHLDTSRLIGGTWCHEDGFLTHDLIYQLGFERATALGVTLHQNTEVLAGVSSNGHLAGVHTTKGYFEADIVVNAANIWGPMVSRRLDGMPNLPVVAEKRYLYTYDPRSPIPGVTNLADLPMTIYGLGNGRGAYSRPTEGGKRLMFGWAHTVKPDVSFNDDSQDTFEPGYRHSDTSRGNFAAALLQSVEDFIPGLSNYGGMAASSAGYYDTTPDHNPLIGFDLVRPNLIHALGFSGHGLMHAPITAALVTALIMGTVEDGRVRLPAPFEDFTIDLAAYRLDRSFDHQESRVI